MTVPPLPAASLEKKGFIGEIAAFALTAVCTFVLHWQARDLIWGLWISSLSVGYAFIVKTILSGVIGRKGPELPLFIGGAVFLLGFFTIHFGMFHFVHSVFLNLFFPLFPMEHSSGFPDMGRTIATTMTLYWPVVLANLIYQWSDFRSVQIDLKGSDAFSKPYANVIRMHLLIFVFAGLSFARLDRLAVYPILAAYFFPWHILGLRIRASGIKTEKEINGSV